MDSASGDSGPFRPDNSGYGQFNPGGQPPGSVPPGQQPYQLPPGYVPAQYIKAPSSPSVPAILSLILSLVSPLLICTCFGPLVLSLVAVVLGHVAHVQISRSGGRVTGWGVALAGLICGYLGLLCYVAYFGLMFAGGMAPGRGLAGGGLAPRSPLDDVERAIDTDSKGIAHGNTDEAKKLAERFAQAMEKKHDESFTKVKTRIQLSGGHYVTWCELREGRCAFVVHVPQYRKFDADAKQYLNELAWRTAHETVQETLLPGDELAVGLKGAFLFGAVMVGRIGELSPNTTSEDKEELAPFMEDDWDDDAGLEHPGIPPDDFNDSNAEDKHGDGDGANGNHAGGGFFGGGAVMPDDGAAALQEPPEVGNELQPAEAP